ncbi:hypothetical protein RRG08_051421 [Elysia crispata]|uniref:Uncharacterized protein n=1 Tax=Elysia crispata TaxID=231223 RepID=A0AAE1B576_9GAST|nr:hypothetical protein RRG08_051421 [Elysia crispata]
MRVIAPAPGHAALAIITRQSAEDVGITHTELWFIMLMFSRYYDFTARILCGASMNTAFTRLSSIAKEEPGDEE